jgi:hypothetical protein
MNGVAESQSLNALGRGVHRMPRDHGIGPGWSKTLPTASAHYFGQFWTVDAGTYLCKSDGLGGYLWKLLGGVDSPLTTKGDLWGYDTDNARVPVGTNGQVLTADSTDAQGIIWQTITSPGSALVLINETAFSAVTSVSLDGVFSSTYQNYKILVQYAASSFTSANHWLRVRAGGTDKSAASSYAWVRLLETQVPAAGGGANGGDTSMSFAVTGTSITYQLVTAEITILDPFSSSERTKMQSQMAQYGINAWQVGTHMGWETTAASADGFTLFPNAGNFTGIVRVYGLQDSPGDPGPSGYSDEDAQDAVGTIWTDSSSIDFTYNDAAPSMTAVVLPAGVDHNSLANLTSGNPHTQYQPIDADLTTIAGLTATTDNVIQSVASAWASRTPAQLKTTLALVKGDVGLGNVDNTSDVNKPVSTAQQTALDAKAPVAAKYIVQTADATLTAEQALSALGTGLVKNTTGTGVLSIGAAGTDYYNPGGTDVAIADGGTGQSTAVAGFNALSPLTTRGDLLTRDATNNVRLALGTSLQGLRVNVGATDVEWGDQDDLVGRFRLTASGSAIGPTIANYFGANSAFSTTSSTIYLFIADCFFTKTTAGTVLWTLTSSVNYTNCVIGFDNPGVLTGNAGTAGAATAAATLASGSLTTAVNHYMKVVALVETNTAGNIRLNVTQSAGTVTPLRGSLYRVYRVTSANVGSFVA